MGNLTKSIHTISPPIAFRSLRMFRRVFLTWSIFYEGLVEITSDKLSRGIEPFVDMVLRSRWLYMLNIYKIQLITNYDHSSATPQLKTI